MALALDAIKVFSATKQKERDELGETATRWLDAHRGRIEVLDCIVRQSSDSAYHCLSITLLYRRLDTP